MKTDVVLISACLVGEKCRYDGGTKYIDTLMALVESGKGIKVCPEQLGGLPTPRIPCEIVVCESKRFVMDKDGNDYTKFFMEGAKRTLEICQSHRIKQAILHAKSPSCGCGKIYDGTFNHSLITGNGLTTELLLKHDIQVIDHETYISQKNK